MTLKREREEPVQNTSNAHTVLSFLISHSGSVCPSQGCDSVFNIYSWNFGPQYSKTTEQERRSWRDLCGFTRKSLPTRPMFLLVQTTLNCTALKEQNILPSAEPII